MRIVCAALHIHEAKKKRKKGMKLLGEWRTVVSLYRLYTCQHKIEPLNIRCSHIAHARRPIYAEKKTSHHQNGILSASGPWSGCVAHDICFTFQCLPSFAFAAIAAHKIISHFFFHFTHLPIFDCGHFTIVLSPFLFNFLPIADHFSHFNGRLTHSPP